MRYRLQTEVSIVPPLLPDYHLPLLPSHTDDTDYSKQAVLCFSKQPAPRLCGHLSAVGVVKFNESRMGLGHKCWDGSGSQTSRSGTGAGELLVGELLAGTGGRGMA